MSAILQELPVPVVQAPMAGGPSTPALAAAVNRGGGLGFLAAGYLTAGRLAQDIETLSGLTDRPFGVNVFVGAGDAADPARLHAYAQRLEADAQRAATATDAPTVLTRAFSGRLARGIVNRWHRDHGDAAPRAYPEVHHLTSPLRAHGRRMGDADLINLWAGQAHRLAEDRSAEEITRLLGIGAREALAAAADRFHD
jgi:nitronate monooxygenase